MNEAIYQPLQCETGVSKEAYCGLTFNANSSHQFRLVVKRGKSIEIQISFNGVKITLNRKVRPRIDANSTPNSHRVPIAVNLLYGLPAGVYLELLKHESKMVVKI
ncbi:hypothetical protein RRG08_035382 [Elysia crispata]|uniref:Uncharacterized protein n=1 Tax=Elysia crispata TaxID=231223 RepID=A0AAE0Y3E4_9GAST|nr:hypothetical protein RRG08_035382 [Elysia crispata]